jgi:hypothetical protein
MPRSLALLLSVVPLWAGCATSPPKAPDTQRQLATARALRQAMEAGRAPGATDDAVVSQLDQAGLAWLLFRGPAPEAGARRLLNLREQRPPSPFAPALVDGIGAADLAKLADSEGFRGGLYFNSYDAALFRPFFRQALLDDLEQPSPDDAAALAQMEVLELALKLTPRFGTLYPNDLVPETRRALEAYVKAHPGGGARDRFAMLLALDQRSSAWAAGRAAAEGDLRALRQGSRDELLKLEIDDALAAPLAPPERSFWLSLLLPGLGQAANGDLEGGLLLGGLTAAAWIWAGSRFVQARQAPDAATQGVAYGDAGLGAGLAVLGHGFTALNAAEEAHVFNVQLHWDLLSRDRLKTEQR